MEKFLVVIKKSGTTASVQPLTSTIQVEVYLETRYHRERSLLLNYSLW